MAGRPRSHWVSRAARASLGLTLTLAACGPESAVSVASPLPPGGWWWADGGELLGQGPEGSALEPLAQPSAARDARLAATASELEQHLERVAAQGLGPALFRASRELLATDYKGLFYPRGEFGINRRDLVWITQWNAATRGAVDTRDSDTPGDELGNASRLRGLVRLSDALAVHGITLLVAPIPRPPQIYPERLLDSAAVPADCVGVDPGLARFLLDATRAGVEVLHLTPHFAAEREVLEAEHSGDRYLYHDWNNHWTPRAVALTAELVGRRVAELEVVPVGELREGWDWRVVERRIELPLPQHADHPIPPASLELECLLDDAGQRASRTDPLSPVLLLGDSNSSWYQMFGAALPDKLFAGLEQRLDVIALQAATPSTIWARAARREGPGSLLEKRVVVWVCEANALMGLDFPLPDRLR